MSVEILAVCLISDQRGLTKSQKQKILGINANIWAQTTFPQSKIKQIISHSIKLGPAIRDKISENC